MDNKIFIFDAGLKYASDSNFGIDYIIPDYKYLVDNKVPCPNCGKSNFTEIREFNLMFETQRGVVKDDKNTVYLTENGLEELKKELDNLINVRRPENIQAIKEARSLGDLSENAEYDAARNAPVQVNIIPVNNEYHLEYAKKIEKMLENVSIISEVSKETVGIGNTVSIKYVDDDEEEEYKIVGSQEADPFESKISNESPIAKALFEHKVGDIVTVESPNGSYEVEIIEIK